MPLPKARLSFHMTLQGRWQAGLRSWVKFRRPRIEPPGRLYCRSHERFPGKYDGMLFGPTGTMQLRGLDLGALGAGVRTWFRIDLGTIVFVQLTTQKLMGFAFIKHCTPRGFGFHLGLQFRNPLGLEDRCCCRYHDVCTAAGSPEKWRKLVRKYEVNYPTSSCSP